MSKFFLSLLALVSSLNAALAQDPDLSCGNGRYTNDILGSDNPVMSIHYGTNTVTTHTSGGGVTTSTVELEMDIYQPAGDVALKRPVVVLAFGGSFITGLRFDMEAYCRAFARKGYVAVTIDYRKITNTLTNVFWYYNSKARLAEEVVKASADMKAAIRYLRAHAATYKLDPNRIFVGGYSSGAITALQTAFVNNMAEITDPDIAAQYAANGGLEGNTDLPAPNNLLGTQTSQGITGVFNIAGAIFDLNWINAGDPPIYSMQGNADGIVPFNTGNVSYFGLTPGIPVNGCNAINTRATTIGLAHILDVIPGGDHLSPNTTLNQTTAVNDAGPFYQPFICQAFILPVTITSFTVQNDNCTPALRWQTATEQGSSRYQIEMATDNVHFSTVGTVLSRNIASGATYSFHYPRQVNTAYFRLKIIDQDRHFTYSNTLLFRSACGSYQVQVHPNPAQNNTTISGLEAGMQVQLINASGQTVWTKTATGANMPVALTTVANGLYIIRVKEETGMLITNSRLIIHHE